MIFMAEEKEKIKRKINKKIYMLNGNKNLVYQFKIKDLQIILMLSILMICLSSKVWVDNKNVSSKIILQLLQH